MKRFFDFFKRVLDLLVEPHDWRAEKNGSSITFTGDFLVYGRAGRIELHVPGRIVEWKGLPAQVFVYDPPAFVKNHPHGRCLQLLHPNDKWFKLHFEKPARDFLSACSYVEQFLTEAYNLKS